MTEEEWADELLVWVTTTAARDSAAMWAAAITPAPGETVCPVIPSHATYFAGRPHITCLYCRAVV